MENTFHVTWGGGFPVARQFSSSDEPSSTFKYGTGDLIMIGGTVNKYNSTILLLERKCTVTYKYGLNFESNLSKVINNYIRS